MDSHVVGWCDVRRATPGSPIDHRGVLGICIRKQFRSRGVGTALMREVLEKCRGKFEIVELSVLATNPRAFELYKRFGFEEIGVLPRAVKRSGIYIDERLMYLSSESGMRVGENHRCTPFRDLLGHENPN